MFFILINSIVAIFFLFLFYLGLRLKITALIPINAAGFVVSLSAAILDILGFENKISTIVIMIIIISLLIFNFLISFRDITENTLFKYIFDNNGKSDLQEPFSSETYKIIDNETIIINEIKNLNGFDDKMKALATNALHRGNHYFSEYRYHAALKQYEISCKHIPTSAACLNKSGIQIQLGEFQNAIESSSQALHINPDLYEAWINESIAYARLNRFDNAVKCLENAERIDPDSSEVHFFRGNFLMRQNKFSDSVLCYENAINFTPDYLEAWYNKGLCLNKLDKPQDAFQCFDTVVALDPKHYQAYYNRGNTLTRLNRNAEAVLSYNKAIKLKSDYSEALNNRGISLYKLGRVRDALNSYEKAIKLNSHAFEAWINHGLLMDNLGLYEKAIYSYRKFIEYAPEKMQHHIEITQKRIKELQKSMIRENAFIDPENSSNNKKAVPDEMKPSENLV